MLLKNCYGLIPPLDGMEVFPLCFELDSLGEMVIWREFFKRSIYLQSVPL